MVMQTNEARERVLQMAERLFHEHGYNGVSMRQIAGALEMRPASLYYHVPDGKEQLFVEVTERVLRRHQCGLKEIMAQAEPDIEARLIAASRWLSEHAPIKLLSMLETDMPAISHENARKLTFMAFQSFFAPLIELFKREMEKDTIRRFDPDQLAGHFLSMMDGISYTATAGHTPIPVCELAEEMIDIFLNGIRSN